MSSRQKAKKVEAPIPEHLMESFMAAMDAEDNDDLPDGAWFASLEEAARRFMIEHGLSGCENSAAHQWVAKRADEIF